MGFFSKIKRAVKAAVTGGLSEVKRHQEKKEAAAQRELDAEQKRIEQQTKQKTEIANQATQKLRQESSDLAGLVEQTDRAGGEMGGILTSVEGLVPGDRKLNRKKLLGG